MKSILKSIRLLYMCQTKWMHLYYCFFHFFLNNLSFSILMNFAFYFELQLSHKWMSLCTWMIAFFMLIVLLIKKVRYQEEARTSSCNTFYSNLRHMLLLFLTHFLYRWVLINHSIFWKVKLNFLFEPYLWRRS